MHKATAVGGGGGGAVVVAVAVLKAVLVARAEAMEAHCDRESTEASTVAMGRAVALAAS